MAGSAGALSLRPRILLLDEPAAGVPSHETEVIHQALGRLPADIAILIIEHDMGVVFRFAHEIVVLACISHTGVFLGGNLCGGWSSG